LSRFGLLEDNSKTFWDDFWKNRGKKNIHSWAKRRIIDILSTYIRPGISVLDAGCGSGFFSSYFISCGCRVYSMDYSEEALSITGNITGHKAKMYIKDDILDIKALLDIDRKFDIIFTDGLLEHYSEHEQDTIILNMKRVKKDNGYLINFVPNRNSIWSLVRPFYINIKERPFFISEFLDLNRRNNLNIVSFGGINVVPFRFSPETLLGKYMGMLLYCIAE